MPMMFPIQTKMFQSTYLYKVRHIALSVERNRWRFNPRTYIRYDKILTLDTMNKLCGVSIHVPI